MAGRQALISRGTFDIGRAYLVVQICPPHAYLVMQICLLRTNPYLANPLLAIRIIDPYTALMPISFLISSGRANHPLSLAS